MEPNSNGPTTPLNKLVHGSNPTTGSGAQNKDYAVTTQKEFNGLNLMKSKEIISQSPNMRPFKPSDVHKFDDLNTNQPSIHLSPREGKAAAAEKMELAPDVSMIMKEPTQSYVSTVQLKDPALSSRLMATQ